MRIHERKRGAGYFLLINRESVGDAFYQNGLTCAERSAKQNYFAAGQPLAQANTQLKSGSLVRRNEFAAGNCRQCCHCFGRVSFLMNSNEAKNLLEFSLSFFPLKTATAI